MKVPSEILDEVKRGRCRQILLDALVKSPYLRAAYRNVTRSTFVRELLHAGGAPHPSWRSRSPPPGVTARWAPRGLIPSTWKIPRRGDLSLEDRVSSDNQDENVATIKVRTRGRDATSAKTMVVWWMRSKGGGAGRRACAGPAGQIHEFADGGVGGRGCDARLGGDVAQFIQRKGVAPGVQLGRALKDPRHLGR